MICVFEGRSDDQGKLFHHLLSMTDRVVLDHSSTADDEHSQRSPARNAELSKQCMTAVAKEFQLEFELKKSQIQSLIAFRHVIEVVVLRPIESRHLRLLLV